MWIAWMYVEMPVERPAEMARSPGGQPGCATRPFDPAARGRTASARRFAGAPDRGNGQRLFFEWI